MIRYLFFHPKLLGKEKEPDTKKKVEIIEQLCMEMDKAKFQRNSIVICATTCTTSCQIDALKKPDKFGFQVQISLPDFKERRDLIKYFLGKLENVGKVNAESWAKKTEDFSGADIENLIDRAAIHAASKGNIQRSYQRWLDKRFYKTGFFLLLTVPISLSDFYLIALES